MNMNISNQTGLSFQGYDVLPLRALYMQGIRKRGEVNIFREMKRIAQIEGLELYLNQDGQNIVKDFGKISGLSKHLPIWGQDNKAFVVNKNGKTILWNSKEYSINPEGLGELGDYKIDEKPYMPRGGDYYLGYKPNGEKWLLINGFSIYDKKFFKDFGDLPTKKILYDLFDVKPKNVITINSFSSDLDEFVRPIGFPYILVNDYNLSLENLEKMKNKFPNSHEPYIELKKFLTEKLNQVQSSQVENDCDTICQILSDYGFKPIRIGGRYSDDINYMNAIAFQNNKNGISYITNSTKKSYPELTYLENLFEENLREKVPKITDTYFVSGGKRLDCEKNSESAVELYGKGLQNRNIIMDILANRLGGIHCMTAEVPDFERINQQLNLIV